ncbi:hypothetical protein BT96DRAFT_568120 [Gymnopus androsaceus JB14]|uniref:Uncharacterized protein n=1 Tax=Gymnopus androsaceus JB14 TaxID=1447944 RepID=A0A6A4GJC4_9AGAR|nr:hypothetical protein BT96DRAFT_568120 [Gymnopus androsaceus JB14]
MSKKLAVFRFCFLFGGGGEGLARHFMTNPLQIRYLFLSLFLGELHAHSKIRLRSCTSLVHIKRYCSMAIRHESFRNIQ